MSTFSFETLNGAMIEPMALDDTTNLNQLIDQSWTDTDLHDSTYGYSYASSNSSFSCGSLTSGYLTPQSSISASTSRRPSLASATRPMSTFGPPAAQPKHLGTPRTPIKYEGPYSSQSFSPQSGYLCYPPTSQGLENSFPMNLEDRNLSGKLHIALGLGEPNCIDTGSFSTYDQEEIISPHISFGSEHGLQSNVPFGNHYGEYGQDRRPYQDYQTSFSANDLDESQPVRLPQTIAPSQTTYKAESTPPPTLGDPFVSPVKPSFGSSPTEEASSFLDRSHCFAYLDDTLASPNNFVSNGSGRSRTSSDFDSEDDEPPFKAEDPTKPSSSFFNDTNSPPKTRAYRRSQAGNRSGGSQIKRAQRRMSYPIKREPGPQHRCPHCIEKTCFKRPEHLTRHVVSKHGEGEEQMCVVPDCGRVIRGRPDNMTAHYRRTHLYGDCKKKGKKNEWLSIERARELGLGSIDDRVNPRQPKVKKEES